MVHTQMVRIHKSYVAATSSWCSVRCRNIGRELACDWTIVDRIDCKLLVLAVIYPVPAVGKSAIDPETVCDARGRCCAILIWGVAIVGIGTLACGTVLREYRGCFVVGRVYAGVEAARICTTGRSLGQIRARDILCQEQQSCALQEEPRKHLDYSSAV